MAKDFIPQREGDLQQWLGNLQTKIGGYAATFGLTPDDITAITGACTRTFTNINAVEAELATYQQLVKKKDNEKSEDVEIIRGFANKIKADSNFTEDIGKDLKLFSEKEEIDASQAKPVLKGRVVPQGVEIKFTKEKVFDGVNIYSRSKGAAQWSKLAMDTSSPYIDNRPLSTVGAAETREYMGLGVIDDVETGLPSDIVSVVYGG